MLLKKINMLCVESKAVGVSVNVRERVTGRVCETEGVPGTK